MKKILKFCIPQQHRGDKETLDVEFDSAKYVTGNYSFSDTGAEIEDLSIKKFKIVKGVFIQKSDTGKQESTESAKESNPEAFSCSVKDCRSGIGFCYLPKSELNHKKIFNKIVKYGFSFSNDTSLFDGKAEVTIDPLCLYSYPLKQKSNQSHL